MDQHHARQPSPVMTPEIIIRMEGLEKWYGDFQVLQEHQPATCTQASASSSAARRAPASRR